MDLSIAQARSSSSRLRPGGRLRGFRLAYSLPPLLRALPAVGVFHQRLAARARAPASGIPLVGSAPAEAAMRVVYVCAVPE